jgi:hypothetical protein
MSIVAWYSQGFADPLGDRLLLFDSGNEGALELLRLRPELAAFAGFEAALLDSVRALSGWRDETHAAVLRAERLAESGGALALVSTHHPGTRLSDILGGAAARNVGIETSAALWLIRELLSALVSARSRGSIAYGALSPERIVVSPEGRLTIVEHLLGPALQRLPFTADQFWRALRVAVPPTDGETVFDERADLMQAAVVALSLLAGRNLGPEECPGGLDTVVDAATWISERGEREPLPHPLKGWLLRALQRAGGRSFSYPIEAARALDEIVLAGCGCPDEAAVRRVLDRHRRALAAAPSQRLLSEAGTPAADAGRPLPAWPSPASDRPPQIYAPNAAFQEAAATDRARRGWKTAALILLAIAGAEAAVIVGRSRAPAALSVAGGKEPVVARNAPELRPSLPPLPMTSPAEATPHRVPAPGPAAASPRAGVPGHRTTVAATGWISVSSPVELQLFVGGRLIGTSGRKVALAPGDHVVEMVNDALGYHTTQTVRIPAGRLIPISLQPAQ